MKELEQAEDGTVEAEGQIFVEQTGADPGAEVRIVVFAGTEVEVGTVIEAGIVAEAGIVEVGIAVVGTEVFVETGLAELEVGLVFVLQTELAVELSAELAELVGLEPGVVQEVLPAEE